MRAGRYDIHIEQGADYELRFVWKDSAGVAMLLTGYQGCMQVRPELGSSVIVLSICNQNLSGTEVVLSFTAAQTDTIKTDPKKLTYVDQRLAQVMAYDVELIDPAGKIIRILQGAANVYPGVTKC